VEDLEVFPQPGVLFGPVGFIREVTGTTDIDPTTACIVRVVPDEGLTDLTLDGLFLFDQNRVIVLGLIALQIHLDTQLGLKYISLRIIH